MKKCFLAVITALSLAGFSYAQDDEYEEEEVVYEEEAEDEAPAVQKSSKKQVVEAEEEEDEAPAPKKAKKKASKPRPAAENGTFGIGAELTGLNAIRIVYNLNADMFIVGLLGFNYDSWSEKAYGVTVDDSNWGAELGAGFGMVLNRSVLPLYVEGDLRLGTNEEDQTHFGIDAWLGAKATVVKSFEIAGQLGLGFTHAWWDEDTGREEKTEHGATNIGLKTKVFATWYFM